MSEFLSIKDVMSKLKISRGAVLKHIKSGKLLAYRIGRVVRVDPAELRGRRYNRAKTAGHGAGSAGQNEPQNTAVRLAKEHGVSPATIKRDAKFAEDPS